ncbi:MAG: hypothetical protein ABIF82_06205 [Planctomycetota bacterium]
MRTVQRGVLRRRRREPHEIIKPPSKAIRSFCLECVGWNAAEVERCSAPECHLWPYRMGGGKLADKMAERG